MKKFLSVALAFLMLAVMLPVVAMAEEGGVMVGETSYATIDEAFNAINATKNVPATIKLMGNVNISASGILPEAILTIDLNGHQLSGSILKDHDMIITDTSEGKNGTAHFTNVRCNVLWLKAGTVTIENANIYHATYVEGANVTINGGKYNLAGTGHTNAINFTSGSLTINGGLFQTNTSLEENGTVIQCSNGYYTVGKTEQGSFTVQKTDSNGNTLYFHDLSLAAKAAKDGDAITLLGDQIIDKQVAIDSSVTINGNGNTITLAQDVEDISASYSTGVFLFSGDGKTSAIKNANFDNIVTGTVLIRAYNVGSNSTFTVEKCNFNNVNAMNVVRASSSTASNIKLVVTNSTFKNCTAASNSLVQIDNGNSSNNATGEIKNNDFINNKISVSGTNVAVVYLSAPAKAENNYFSGNTTATDANSKNGIIVTGSNAGGSTITGNAFENHTFENGKGQGAVYGAAGATTVSNNYYGANISHLVNSQIVENGVAAGFERDEVNRGAKVNNGTTGGTIVIITPSEDTTPKTDDQKNPTTGANDVVAAAVALMAVSALGMAVLTRKK